LHTQIRLSFGDSLGNLVPTQVSLEDIKAVLDEIARLQVVEANLRGSCAILKEDHIALTAERDAALARVARLEVALKKILYIPKDRPYICGDEDGKCYWDHAEDIARAALEVKP